MIDTHGTSIYIVEDEIPTAAYLRTALESLGYPVCGLAVSAEEAVRDAGQLNPDLVLMDIFLAGKMDGIEAAELLIDSQNIPVIFLTAYSGDELLRRAGGVKHSGYLLKPFSSEQLRACVESAVIPRRDHQAKFEFILDNCPETVFMIDGDKLSLKYINRAVENLLGYRAPEFLKLPVDDFFPPASRSFFLGTLKSLLKEQNAKTNKAKGLIRKFELETVHRTGRKLRLDFSLRLVADAKGRPMAFTGTARESYQFKDYSPFEAGSRSDRPHGLQEPDQSLYEKIEELENRLLEQKALSQQSEIIKSALVLLQEQQKQDRENIEKTLMRDLNSAVLPFLSRLKKSGLSVDMQSDLDTALSNLQNIFSPFFSTLSVRAGNLTPREMQVAGLIRQGRSSKEIADQLCLSTRSVEFHRDNIRRKLGLKGKKQSLKVFLNMLH